MIDRYLHSLATPTLATLLATALAPAALASAPSGDAASGADRLRATVAEMLADADGRTSLLQSGAAGHDGHFHLASTDGGFRLQVEGQIQFRYIANFRDEDNTVNDDDFESGFTNGGVRLRFSGNVFGGESGGPAFIYGVEGRFDHDTGGFTLEDAFVGHAFENGLILIWGQYKEPILWEDVIQEKASLTVTESTVNAVFRQDRTQGIWLHYAAEDWRIWAGFSDGIRAENSEFTGDPSDWSLTSRAELKLSGDWAQFGSFTSEPGSDYGVKLGGGIHWQDGPNDSPGEVELGAWTADIMCQGDGWNLFAMGVGLFTEPAAGDSNTDWGFLVQGGFFIPDTDWELFARYDVVVPDDGRAGDDDFNTISFGVNHYIHGQAAKFTADVVWYLDDTTGNDLVSGVAGTRRGDGIGLLPSPEDDQLALRFQFQLLF